MIDIDQYDYSKEPFTSGNKFKVTPLSDLGRSQYFYDKDSHAKVYLDMLNPRKLKQIHAEKLNYENYIANKQQEKRRLEEEMKHSEAKEGFGNCSAQVRPSSVDCGLRSGEAKEEVFDSAALTKGAERNIGLSKAMSTGNLWETKKKFTFKRLDEKVATFGSNSFGKKIHRNMKNSIELKNGTRFNMLGNALFPQDSNFFVRENPKKIGFESYNVPQIRNFNRCSSTKPIKFNEFSKRCLNSISNGFFQQQDGFDSKELINQKIVEENIKLKEILFSQTSEGFLKVAKLPKISYIVNQPQIIIKKTGISNSRFMGLKYNPHNFNSGTHKNMTKRNNHGALFLH